MNVHLLELCKLSDWIVPIYATEQTTCEVRNWYGYTLDSDMLAVTVGNTKYY